MKEKTAYIIEGHVILVPGKEDHRQAAERIVQMLKLAILPSPEEIFTRQDARDAFLMGNGDAKPLPPMAHWQRDLPADVTTVYETAVRYGPLKLSEEPRIQTYRRRAPDKGPETDRIYMLSWLLKEHGKGLGRGDHSPIAQIQAAGHMHLCIHEDHLQEMTAYAQEHAERTADVADMRLQRLLEAALSVRQTEAERKSSPRIMRSLRDFLCGDRPSMAA